MGFLHVVVVFSPLVSELFERGFFKKPLQGMFLFVGQSSMKRRV